MDGLTSDKPNRQQATAFHIFIKVDKIIPNGNVFSDPFLEGNQIYLKAHISWIFLTKEKMIKKNISLVHDDIH